MFLFSVTWSQEKRGFLGTSLKICIYLMKSYPVNLSRITVINREKKHYIVIKKSRNYKEIHALLDSKRLFFQVILLQNLIYLMNKHAKRIGLIERDFSINV